MKLQVAILLTLLMAGFTIFLQSKTINAQKSALNESQKNYKTISGELIREQQVATFLRKQSATNAQQKRTLNKKLLQLEALSNTRLKTIEELQHENEELRHWASQPLPAAIVRLRQRPAITGHYRYCEHLRNTSALPTEPSLCPQ